MQAADGKLVFRPLTPELWPALVDLFGPQRGASSGCWCMWTRISRPDWRALGPEGRRDRFHAIVEAGPPPGLLAFRGETAVGWCAVGPRPTLGRFQTMKASAPAGPDGDGDRVFAISCFYVRAGHRRQGLTAALAEAAVAFARKRRARAVEVCAIETDRKLVWGEGFVGLASVFRKLGFTEIARRTPTRPLMRLELAASNRVRVNDDRPVPPS